MLTSRQVFTAVILVMTLQSVHVYAQCTGCTPTRQIVGAGANYEFDANVPTNVRNAFNAAAGRWNVHFQDNNLVRRFNPGAGFVIKIDPSIQYPTLAFWDGTSGPIRVGTFVRDSPNENLLDSVAFHELGHQTGWDNQDSCGYQDSVMAPKCDSCFDNPTDFTVSDGCAFNVAYQRPVRGDTGGDPNQRCTVNCSSPILISLDGSFDLAEPSVLFDLGEGQQMYSWPAVGARTGFLVLDRDGDGAIRNGRELFGNWTPVGWGFEGPTASNGFDALAYYDNPLNGGNGDGVISDADAIYSQLRIWFDTNADGHSDSDELFELKERGIVALSLDAKESGKQDRFGNEFRFRAAVWILNRSNVAVRRDVMYDVFLASK